MLQRGDNIVGTNIPTSFIATVISTKSKTYTILIVKNDGYVATGKHLRAGYMFRIKKGRIDRWLENNVVRKIGKDVDTWRAIYE